MRSSERVFDLKRRQPHGIKVIGARYRTGSGGYTYTTPVSTCLTTEQMSDWLGSSASFAPLSRSELLPENSRTRGRHELPPRTLAYTESCRSIREQNLRAAASGRARFRCSLDSDFA